MINRTILIGRITRDLELRKTTAGKSIVNFTLAVNRSFNRDEADFISCIAWEKTADYMANYLEKGTLVSIEGRIQTGSYEDKTGKKVYTQDVVVETINALESKEQRTKKKPIENESPSSAHEPILDITSDDLPF